MLLIILSMFTSLQLHSNFTPEQVIADRNLPGKEASTFQRSQKIPQDTFDLSFFDDYPKVVFESLGEGLYRLHHDNHEIAPVYIDKIGFRYLSDNLFLFYDDFESFLLLGNTQTKQTLVLYFWRNPLFEEIRFFNNDNQQIILIVDNDRQGLTRTSFITIHLADFSLCSTSFLSKVDPQPYNPSNANTEVSIKRDSLGRMQILDVKTILKRDITQVDTIFNDSGNWYLKRRGDEIVFDQEVLEVTLKLDSQTGCFSDFPEHFTQAISNFTGIEEVDLLQLLNIWQW